MARKLKGTDTAVSMDEKEIFDKHMAIIRPLKREAELKRDEMRAANSTYRNALKAAGKEGIKIGALTEALDMQKQDPEEVNRHIAAVNRYLLWLGAPIGTQFGLLPSGETVASAVDKAAIERAGFEGPARDGAPASTEPAVLHINNAAKARAYGEGKDAGVAGKNKDTCPYKNPANRDLRTEWEKGYDDAQEERALAMGPPKKQRSRKKREHTAEEAAAVLQ